jgi:hypothetical protein
MLRCTQKVRSAFGTGKPRPRRRSAHDVEEAVYLSDEIAVMRLRPGRIVDRLNAPLSRPGHARLSAPASSSFFRGGNFAGTVFKSGTSHDRFHAQRPKSREIPCKFPV